MNSHPVAIPDTLPTDDKPVATITTYKGFDKDLRCRAAYQIGLTGSHANAVRLFSEATRDAAWGAGETYADKRHAYLVREGR